MSITGPRPDEDSTPSRQLTEFIAGLDKHLHKAQVDPNRANMQAVVAYVRSWLVSLTLADDAEWQGQIADFERRAEQGDLGEPMDATRLRESLKTLHRH